MKKLNIRGFSHVEALVVLVVVALISGVGFVVWQRSGKAINPVSQAESRGWKTILPNRQYGIRVRICRIASSPERGLKAWADKDTSEGESANVSFYVEGYTQGNPASFSASELKRSSLKTIGGYTHAHRNPNIKVYRRGTRPDSSHTTSVRFVSLPVCP